MHCLLLDFPMGSRPRYKPLMRPERSVHDNVIYAFSVDCERRRIVLHTAFRERDPHEFTDVVFRDVVAHQFEHVLSGNILFDVERTDVEQVVRDSADLLSDSWRFGWPPVEYNGNLDILVSTLKAASVGAYLIRSSYGLSGWVFAVECERLSRSERAGIA